jgi:hypothetical protein
MPKSLLPLLSAIGRLLPPATLAGDYLEGDWQDYILFMNLAANRRYGFV